MTRHLRHSRRRQQGASLLEALVAILIFSLGLLGLIGLQATSIRNTADAKYRADAAYLANQIIGQIWADDRAALGSYAHFAGAGAVCAPGGGASGNANVSAWTVQVSANLPGAAANKQQITVNAATGLVTVTICWQSPQDPQPHNFVTSAQVAG
jgi:type IV pilus assembly protein PilV